MISEAELKIYNSIKIKSDNDPLNPEFPFLNPKFPATETKKIHIKDWGEIFIKDESSNLTGTHKDRMAWEIITWYKQFLEAKKLGLSKENLPHMSLISSGSAALAIQAALKFFKLPKLKVLVDFKIDSLIEKKLKNIGCEIFKIDLSQKILSGIEILALTNNENGFDITSFEAFKPGEIFYDWLSYEILNENPTICFIPFGTGHLYTNILNTAQKEVINTCADARFLGDKNIIRKCNFFGVTTNNPISKADKLFSPHLPFNHVNDNWLRFFKQSGICGKKSCIYSIEENFLDEALDCANKNKIVCEASGIAGLALFLKIKNSISPSEKVLIVNTGKSKMS